MGDEDDGVERGETPETTSNFFCASQNLSGATASALRYLFNGLSGSNDAVADGRYWHPRSSAATKLRHSSLEYSTQPNFPTIAHLVQIFTAVSGNGYSDTMARTMALPAYRHLMRAARIAFGG